MKTLLALFALMPCLAFGQGFGSFYHDQPYLAKSAGDSTPSPESLATNGLAYRWVASDADTNTPLASWTDRIQGHQFTQGSASNRPTNSLGQGIWLDVGHWFVNTPLTISTNNAVGMILNMILPNTGTHPGMFISGTSGAALINCGFYLSSSDNYALLDTCNSLLVTGGRFSSQTNKTVCLVVSQEWTNTSGSIKCYLDNGLSGSGSASTSLLFIGYNNTNSPNTLGRNLFRNSGPQWWIKEIWIWTNTPPEVNEDRSFLLETRNAFYEYTTNTYSP